TEEVRAEANLDSSHSRSLIKSDEENDDIDEVSPNLLKVSLLCMSSTQHYIMKRFASRLFIVLERNFDSSHIWIGTKHYRIPHLIPPEKLLTTNRIDP
uniref:Uncharacterized protein n=1 Tax=Romanomermis culicivorax TaxID=13658 RepID=A0A915JH45_ROMCU